MSVYTTAKCGHCGEKWTSLNPNVPWGIIGPPIIKCGSCYKDNKTRHKLMRDLNPIFKWTILIVRSFTGILVSLGILAASVALFIYGWPYFFDNFTNGKMLGKGGLNIILGVIFNVIGLLLPLIFLYIGVNGIKNNVTYSSDVKEVERVFDENGGFIWSHEAYGYTYL